MQLHYLRLCCRGFQKTRTEDVEEEKRRRRADAESAFQVSCPDVSLYCYDIAMHQATEPIAPKHDGLLTWL